MLAVAREHGLATHLDGARLLNAVVASGVDAADWAGGFDTAWLDFTKGLGAPVGACLAGSRETSSRRPGAGSRCRRRHAPGRASSPRAGLYALDHHVERLADDHANAPRAWPRGSRRSPGVALDPATVETNIVIFAVPDAAAFCAALAARGMSS